MGGFCPDCGNTMCICKAILATDTLNAIKEENALLIELVQEAYPTMVHKKQELYSEQKDYREFIAWQDKAKQFLVRNV